MVVLPTGGVVLALIDISAYAGGLEQIAQSVGVVDQGLLIRGFHENRADNHLDRRDTRGQHKTLIISVAHDAHADGSGGKSPGCLPGDRATTLLILIENLEHFTKVLAQIVRGGGLNSAASFVDKSFDGGGVQATCKFLSLSLGSLHDGNGQELLICLFIHI